MFGIGVDKKIHNHIDWRVVEADGGFLSGYAVGYGALPNQSNYQVTLGTGLVFRIRQEVAFSHQEVASHITQ